MDAIFNFVKEEKLCNYRKDIYFKPGKYIYSISTKACFFKWFAWQKLFYPCIHVHPFLYSGLKFAICLFVKILKKRI